MSVVPLPAARLGSQDALPLSNLLCNWARKTQDHMFELLENLQSRSKAGMDEAARRASLFTFFTTKQRQLGQIYALLRWFNENQSYLDRLQQIQNVLDKRLAMFDHTCETMHILNRRVEDRL